MTAPATLQPVQPVTLEGEHVRLEPLSMAHVDALVAASSEDRSNYQWTFVPEGEDATVTFSVCGSALAGRRAGTNGDPDRAARDRWRRRATHGGGQVSKQRGDRRLVDAFARGLERLAEDAIAGVTTDAGRLDVHRLFGAVTMEQCRVDERQPSHPDLQEDGEPAEPAPDASRGVH